MITKIIGNCKLEIMEAKNDLLNINIIDGWGHHSGWLTINPEWNQTPLYLLGTFQMMKMSLREAYDILKELGF